MCQKPISVAGVIYLYVAIFFYNFQFFFWLSFYLWGLLFNCPKVFQSGSLCFTKGLPLLTVCFQMNAVQLALSVSMISICSSLLGSSLFCETEFFGPFFGFTTAFGTFCWTLGGGDGELSGVSSSLFVDLVLLFVTH